MAWVAPVTRRTVELPRSPLRAHGRTGRCEAIVVTFGAAAFLVPVLTFGSTWRAKEAG